MAIDFEKPPINEVVIGKVYETRTDLTIPYFGRFWDLVKDEFPTCEHAIPIVDQPAANMLAALGSLLPRVWFIGQDATRLIQLQQDRFYYDWRQTPGQSENYVRFDSIYKQYRKYSVSG